MDEWNGDPDDQKDAAKDPEEGSKDEAMGDTKKRRTEEDGVVSKAPILSWYSLNLESFHVKTQ